MEVDAPLPEYFSHLIEILKEYRTGGFLSSEGIFEKLRFIPQVYFTEKEKML